MANRFNQSPHVISANELMSGAVVYLNNRKRWSACIAHACTFHDLETAQQIVGERQIIDSDAVVGIEPVAVEIKPGQQTVPLRLRDRLRLNGPSIAFAASHSVE